jgi:hypothetical protein
VIRIKCGTKIEEIEKVFLIEKFYFIMVFG